MEYAKCQQRDEDDDDSVNDYQQEEEDEDEEGFEDEPSQRKRQQSSRPFDENKNPPNRKMAPLELELRVLGDDNNDDNFDDHHGDSADEDAVSLLGGGGSDAEGEGGSHIAGDFYYYGNSNNASFDDGSVYSRRSATRDFYSSSTDGTLRVWYGCAFIVLSLLVAAIFVAPSPGNNRHKGGDSHYRSPASSASSSSSSSKTEQLACELEFTNNASWIDFLQNISDPNYGMRCSSSSSTSQQQKSCTCQNPTMADFPHQPQAYAQHWQQTFHQNLERVGQWEDNNADTSHSSNIKNLDVVFLGDSITEHWVGTSLGVSHSMWSGNARVFQSLFGDVTSSTQPSSKASNLLGMALGIAGDRCPNLLYRLQNGELGGSAVAAAVESSKLQPSIWWILIGTNDLGSDKCAVDQVIAGIITIVEYLRRERPQATIVVNSILPCGIRDETTSSSTTSPEAELLHWRDYYQPVNQALECYVQGQDSNDDKDNDEGKLYFFNATDLFLTGDGLRINRTRMPDNLHPGEEGSRIWGSRIQEEIHAILAA